jgi:hypothetical protein
LTTTKTIFFFLIERIKDMDQHLERLSQEVDQLTDDVDCLKTILRRMTPSMFTQGEIENVRRALQARMEQAHAKKNALRGKRTLYNTRIRKLEKLLATRDNIMNQLQREHGIFDRFSNELDLVVSTQCEMQQEFNEHQDVLFSRADVGRTQALDFSAAAIEFTTDRRCVLNPDQRRPSWGDLCNNSDLGDNPQEMLLETKDVQPIYDLMDANANASHPGDMSDVSDVSDVSDMSDVSDVSGVSGDGDASAGSPHNLSVIA